MRNRGCEHCGCHDRLDINSDKLRELENHAYAAYGDGAEPDIIVGVVLRKLNITVDGEELPKLDFSYEYGPINQPVTEWERIEV